MSPSDLIYEGCKQAASFRIALELPLNQITRGRFGINFQCMLGIFFWYLAHNRLFKFEHTYGVLISLLISVTRLGFSFMFEVLIGLKF